MLRDVRAVGTALREERYSSLEALFSDDELIELRREAELRALDARPWSSTGYSVSRKGRLDSPRRHRTGESGPRLRELHEGRPLGDFLSEAVGAAMFPTRAAYLYYRPGDHVGLHTDVDVCELTLVVNVEGDTGPLVLHPDLRGVTGDSLRALSEATNGFPAGGLPQPLPHGGALALLGSSVPHHRPPVTTPSTIATLCYSGIA